MKTLFLDPDSRQAVGWEIWWSQFQPVSPCGIRAKAALQPFLPGEEAQVRQAFDVLMADRQWMTADVRAKLREVLQQIPDLADPLQSLAGPGVLTAKHLLAVKGFAHRGRDLAVRVREAHGNFISPGLFESILVVFGNPESLAFSVQDAGHSEYTEASRAYALAVGRAAEVYRAQAEDIRAKTGLLPTRDGQVVCPLPDAMERVKALKQDPALRWVRDTPLESVFEVVPTADVLRAQAERDEAKRRMEQAEQYVLRDISDKLRAEMGTLRRLEAAVADLDLRAARVVLMAEWNAVVPEWSEAVEIEGGVHQPLKAQLEKRGHTYTPVSMALSQNANVVFGSNMGGKTVAMTLLFACQALVQYGLPVPALRFQTQLFPVLRFCASAKTDTEAGLSSFGKEVARLSEAWLDLTRAGGLLCVDEPGRTTNPVEGEAFAIGILRASMQDQRHPMVVLLATHFPAAILEPGVRTFRVRGLVEEAISDDAALRLPERLTRLAEAMDYRILQTEGAEPVFEAFRIAAWLGLPDDLLRAGTNFLCKKET